MNSCLIDGDAEGVGVYVTLKAKQRAGKYLDENDLLPAWMDEHYEIVEHDSDSVAFLSCKALYDDFKASEHFQTLNAREKRLLNQSKFKGAIKKSTRFKLQIQGSQDGPAEQRRVQWQGRADRRAEEVRLKQRTVQSRTHGARCCSGGFF